jgi:CBS domain-containing membrane protein
MGHFCSNLIKINIFDYLCLKFKKENVYQTMRRNIRKLKIHLSNQFVFDKSELIWSWIGAFLGIGSIAYINSIFFSSTDMVLLIGSFGASAVLVYGTIESPLAQPRNLIGGHLLSGFIGVTISLIFHQHLWFAAALAVSTSIAVMQATKTLHPPGGATALIAVIGGEKIKKLGYWFLIMPVGTGVLIILLLALLINNLSSSRKYPQKWF